MTKKPEATIRRIGRFHYVVQVIDGLVKLEPHTIWGYRRAVRLGKKELAHWLKHKVIKEGKEIKIE